MLKNNSKISFIILCLICVVFLYAPYAEAGDEASLMPVFYPEGETGSANPCFIWYDKNAVRDSSMDIKYRISVRSGKGNEIYPVLIKPDICDSYFFYFRFPARLEPDKYTYTIDRLVDAKETDQKYFHYLKYPIKGEFEVDFEISDIKDNLPPDRLIEYLKAEKANRLQNGYNFLFYGSAGIGSFGIGLLFYKVLDFGIISRIIYTVAFTSSAVGAGAAGYYGCNYIVERSRMRKIADVGSNVSINSDVSADKICAGFRVSY